MRVIMIHDMDKVGRRGQTVSVAKGYARNFLFPRGLAVLADSGNERQLQMRLKNLEKRDEQERTDAQGRAERIQGAVVKFTMAAGEEDRLYGSVTGAMVASELGRQGHTVDPRQVDLPDHIKQLGAYTVPVRLHRDVRVEIQVLVERQ
jgi:large subunit ribosomal protein L9